MGHETSTGEIVKASIQQLMEWATEEDLARQAQLDGLLRTGSNSGTGFGDADLVHWARMPFWTPEQAAALSLGKNPDLITWDACVGKASYYPFCAEFLKRCTLAYSWSGTDLLPDPASPVDAIEWMIQLKLIYPNELQKAVELVGGRPTNWKAIHANLAQRFESLRSEYMATLDRHAEAILEKDEQLAEYASWVENARAHFDLQATVIEGLESANTLLQDERDRFEEEVLAHRHEQLGERSRGTYEKIILAFSIEELGFQPGGGPSPIPAEIAAMTDKQGFGVSSETVSKRLREAADRHWIPVE